MTHHRSSDDTESPTTLDDDVDRAFGQLHDVAQRLDESEVRIIAEAAAAAARTGRRFVYVALAALAVVLIAVAVVLGLTASAVRDEINRTSQLIAGDTASQEVSSARSGSLVATRADFAKANAALTAAGLTPIPDPGLGASAYQVAEVTGEALGTLRAVGELQKRGVDLPGVSAPDPESSRFPNLIR